MKNLEYHLLGNHLLENAFSLLFGAYYFRDIAMYRKAYKLLISELNEQILNDGAHFELSPMYHQILLHRLLDCINVVSNNNWKEDKLLEIMNKKALYMLSWLKNMTFSSGNIPFLNDACGNIAPSSSELFKYAERLGIKCVDIPLSESNYRIFKNKKYTIICDIGGIYPSYQPGHAHADTFNFVLEVNGKSVFVDTGCSTYEIGKIRMYERGTSAHNTVVINGNNSSHIWASHRVGKRAKIKILEDTPHRITTRHNGYKGCFHIRSFIQKDNHIEIMDVIDSKKQNIKSTALFHLDHGYGNIDVSGNSIFIQEIKITFEGLSDIYIDDYEQAIEFNKRVKAKCICVGFNKKLKTIIAFQ